MISHFLAFGTYLLLILYFFRIRYIVLVKNLLFESMQSISVLLDNTKSDRDKEELLQKMSLQTLKSSFLLLFKTTPFILLTYLAYFILPDWKYAVLYSAVAFFLVYKSRNRK